MPVETIVVKAPYFLKVGQNFLNQPPFASRIATASRATDCPKEDLRRGLICLGHFTKLSRLPNFNAGEPESKQFYLRIGNILDTKIPGGASLLYGIIKLAPELTIYPGYLTYIRENHEKPPYDEWGDWINAITYRKNSGKPGETGTEETERFTYMDAAVTYPFWLNDRQRRTTVSYDENPKIFSQAKAVGLLQRFGPDESGQGVVELPPEELRERKILLGPRIWTLRAAGL